MHNNSVSDFVCPKCGSEVKEDDDFCPHCGVIFAEGVHCEKHPEIEASGVCIVCAVPCCDECGGTVKDRFLCNCHSAYEIYEGMVRVYGSLDEAMVGYVKSCLEEASLHPVLFFLQRLKGGARSIYVPFAEGGGLDDGVLSKAFFGNEIKVMVPCQEVEDAENVLKTLNIQEPS